MQTITLLLKMPLPIKVDFPMLNKPLVYLVKIIQPTAA
jgi:hypothetical protein